MDPKNIKFSCFISNPGIFFQNQTIEKKLLLRLGRKNLKKNKINCQNSKEKTKDNEQWLESILSVRNQTEKKYINKWRKVGVNLIKGLPFPSKIDESWKFTSLDEIFSMRFSKTQKKLSANYLEKHLESYPGPKIVFLNGVYSNEFSNLYDLNKDVFIGDIKDYPNEGIDSILDFMAKGESGINGGFFPILNIACLSEIFLLFISPGLELKTPINIIYLGSGESVSSSFNHRLVIISGENSKSKIIESHIGIRNSIYFDNTAISILTKEKSELDFFLVNETSEQSILINSIYADIKENSSLNISTLSLGGLVSRINLGIDINGTNCRCNIKGATLAKDNQVSDFHSRISHNLPNSKSSQLQKILLTDKAHGVFAGKIQVQHGAGNSISDQLCKTLLLSSGSRIDALPILEINNENVKCTHGSTVSDLDKNHLFYLQSRGIAQNDAKKMLTIGFVNEMIEDFPSILKSKITRQINSLI
jgi:Fe-S cluster assembly protein SufD